MFSFSLAPTIVSFFDSVWNSTVKSKKKDKLTASFSRNCHSSFGKCFKYLPGSFERPSNPHLFIGRQIFAEKIIYADSIAFNMYSVQFQCFFCSHCANVFSDFSPSFFPNLVTRARNLLKTPKFLNTRYKVPKIKHLANLTLNVSGPRFNWQWQRSFFSFFKVFSAETTWNWFLIFFLPTSSFCYNASTFEQRLAAQKNELQKIRMASDSCMEFANTFATNERLKRTSFLLEFFPFN